MRTLRLAVVLTAGALALSACGNSANKDGKDTSASSAQVKIVATTTQICDYVAQIATDTSPNATLTLNKTDPAGKKTTVGAAEDKAKSTINLTCLLAPNASAHEHEMTPAQSKALANADLMLVSGVDLEHFLDDAVKSTGFKGTMGVTSGILSSKDVDDITKVKEAETSLPYKVDRGITKVNIAKWPFPPEQGESEPEFRFDPHVWTSPRNASVQVRNIGSFLDKASPANKGLFDKHVSAYSKTIDDLDAWAKKSLDSVPVNHRVLFSSHDAFGYFAKNYDVKFIGAAMSDFNNQQDATADKIAESAAEVKKSGARAIFAENSNNSKSIEAVAKAAGVKAIVGDDALYGDSLGPDSSEGATYVGSIVHNVTNLVKAWDGTVAKLPGSLKTATK